MGTPVRDITHLGQTRRKVGGSGSSDQFQTAVTIPAAQVVQQVQNLVTPVDRVYGDGRKWGPILTSTPGSVVPGQTWVERIAGVDYFAYVDSGGVIRYLAPSGTPPTVLTVPLTNLSPTPNLLSSLVVDTVGLASWTIGFAQPSTGSRTQLYVTVGHNGTPSADATVTQINQLGGVSVGSFGVTVQAVLVGVGVAQTLRLEALTAVPGWTAYLYPNPVQTP